MWTDGSVWDYTEWGYPQPDDLDGEDCLETAKAAYWNDNKCKIALPFVCKI